MPSLGPMEIILIILVIVILFGWNKLPDAARSLGRSMRIFKSEVEEMKKDKPSTASRETVPGTTVPPADAGTPPYQAPYQAPQQAPRPPHDPSAYQPQPGHPQAPPPSA
ncbi:MAG: Sec-independent protein translocase subunit TatA [Austwickia sp.]|jgi:sec-independent protein translocase protein TatA|nr:Sec-independent protein translocase subunit TatA [Austwickia sp.]